MTKTSEGKIRVVVNDGYSFLFLTDIRDRDGEEHFFPVGKKEPAGPGSILELDPVQILGQERKVTRVDAVKMRCNNTGCKKEFETTAADLAYAWCPHCGGRGGDLLGVVKKAKTKSAPSDADRMERAEDNTRDDEPDEEVDVEPKKKKAKKTKKEKK